MKFYRWPKGGIFVDEYFAVYENGILFLNLLEEKNGSSIVRSGTRITIIINNTYTK